VAGPMRNRVSPMGDIVAVPARGAWMGNRGILHKGTDIVRFHRGALWIICALRFRGWRARQWQPGHYTVLFFHDEAVALAAGHRPCALCRREDYNAYRRAWAAGHGTDIPLAVDIDRQLHGERIARGTHSRRLHPFRWPDLPDGAFALLDGVPALVAGDAVLPWSPAGYGAARPRPAAGAAEVITPPATVLALRHGYRPQCATAVP